MTQTPKPKVTPFFKQGSGEEFGDFGFVSDFEIRASGFLKEDTENRTV
jgi:hypothetical protein